MAARVNLIKPCLSERFSGLIWKVQVHQSGVIGIETRDTELKQVSFSAFNFKTGETYFKQLTYDEKWNLSLAFASERNLILSAREHSETPENKGLISIQTLDGSIRWQKYNISLNQTQEAGLQVYDSRLQPRKYYWIDHLSGEIINTPSNHEASEELLFPEIDPSFVIPSFIERGILAGELVVLRHSGKVFLSFHERDGDFFKQRLIVFQDDKVLIDDILISGIQKLQPEAFFIQQNHLFYIRHKEEMVTYLV